MPQLSNVPKQQTYLRLARAKSFSLGLWFHTKDQRTAFGTPALTTPTDGIDITGDTVQMVVYEKRGGAVVYTGVAELVDPEQGYARVDLQTGDTDLPAKIYDFTITWTADNYVGAVVQGELEIVGNGVVDPGLPDYDITAPLNLGIELDERNHIHVVVDFMRAPDLGIGTVTTLAPGEEAQANFTGKYPRQLLNLGIPRGFGGDPPGLEVGDVIIGENPNDADVELVPDGIGQYIMNFKLPRGNNVGGRVYLDSYALIEGDGVTNDRVQIQALVDALDALGGGTIEMGSKVYGLQGVLTVKNGVWFEGLGREVSQFKMLDGTSKIQFGSWAGDSRPGGLIKVGVDGNGTGDPAGLIQFQAVFAHVLFCSVTSGAGHNILLDAAQNAEIIGSYSTLAGDAALAIKNGAGGYNFLGSHFTSSQKCLKIFDEDGVANNAYPFGSAHINFFGGIFEQYANGVGVADLRCGSLIKFWGTGFSVNGAVTMSDGYVVRVGNEDFPAISTYVDFNGCNFNGGNAKYDLVRIEGNQYVSFNGEQYIQQSLKPIHITAGSPRVRVFGDFVQGANITAPLIQTSGAGSDVSVYNDHFVGEDYQMPATRTTVVSSRIQGDAGHRFFRDAYGLHSWNSGDDFGVEASLGMGAFGADRYLYTPAGGFYLNKRLGRTHPAIAFPNGAVTIDTRNTNVYRATLTGAGNISSMTLQNPMPGAELRIILAWNEGGQNVTWPADVIWPTGIAPTDKTGGTMTIVDMYYDDDFDKWVAYNVAIRVPLSGGPYDQPAIYQYTAAQTDTQLPIPSGAKYGRIRCASGGQGGGSGRQGAAGSVRCGGGGGAGGAYSQVDFRVADLAVTTLYVTVGAGGNGGAAQAAADSNGNPGNQGGDSAVKTAAGAVTMANCLAHALSTSVSSTVPAGGTNAAGAGGVGGFGERPGQNGGAASATGGTGGFGLLTNGSANAGGGAGGGITSGNAASAGGAGGWVYGRGLVQAAGGTAGNPGAAGTNGPVLGLGQGGGGGGGNGGAGGAGGRGAGGGGGGASLNGTASGAGGAGGAGFVEVTFWFN